MIGESHMPGLQGVPIRAGPPDPNMRLESADLLPHERALTILSHLHLYGNVVEAQEG